MIIPALLLFPAAAQAHPGLPYQTHAFATGLAHPLSGLDHLLAMTAVGLWAVQRGGRALWLAPLAFISVMQAGAILAMGGAGQIPFNEQVIAASVLIFGILLAVGGRVPVAAGMALIGFFAFFHGYAHGAEMPATVAGVAYDAGFVLTTGLLHAAGIALGLTARQARLAPVVPYAGLAVSVCGAFLLFTC